MRGSASRRTASAILGGEGARGGFSSTEGREIRTIVDGGGAGRAANEEEKAESREGARWGDKIQVNLSRVNFDTEKRFFAIIPMSNDRRQYEEETDYTE